MSQARIDTRAVTLSIPTQRHGTCVFEGTLTAVNDFTYWIELPQFPDIGPATESAEDAIAFTSEALQALLDGHTAAYWRRQGIL